MGNEIDTAKLAKVKAEIGRLKRKALEHTNAAYTIRMGDQLLAFIALLDNDKDDTQ